MIVNVKNRLWGLLLLAAVSVSVQAENTYTLAGPYEVIARDGTYRSTKAGSERDMKAALTLAQQGDTAQSLLIVNAYARTLQRLEGHDAPLCLIQGYDLVQAMILLQQHQTEDWARMVRRAFLPTIDAFEAASPYANGNWGAIVNRMRMACAIFLNDSTLYQHAVRYYLSARDNGSLPCYIGETGQCQETGRDQAHVQLGLEALCQICEMAWQYRGDDLWGALDNRLLKGMEYTARYNLGYDVPFETWTDCTGLYCDWTEPGAMSRGKLWDIYRLPYTHYHDRQGLDMPYTRMALEVLAGKRKINVKEYTRLHQATTYPAPQGAPLKHDYEVYVQPRGSKEWTRIDTYMAKVNAPIGDNKHRVSEISYAFFDFTGDVFVRVITKNKKFQTARIRPDYKGVIAHVQNDSTLQFLLFQPENVSVEFDGSITDNLLLFTSKPPIAMADAKKEARRLGQKFVYYAPGYYTQDTLHLQSNTTYYLAGGAYFTSNLVMDSVENVRILGRGIARPPRGYEGCHVSWSKNVLIDGVILNTCPIGGSDGVTLHDVRSISHPSWGDGLNVFASQNVTYDRVFCRNSDDCTTAYATRKGFTGSVHNVHMKNSTLWADVAHPIMIGIHGQGSVSTRSDSLVNLRYENIDILMQSEPQIDYQGCLAINCGDNNVVHGVVFDNIRIENLHQGSLLHVKTCYNSKYCTAPGRCVEDVLFRNLRYTGDTPYLSIINAYDADHPVRNIRFEGLKINGRPIYDTMPGKPRWYKTADYAHIFVGDNVSGIEFAE